MSHYKRQPRLVRKTSPFRGWLWRHYKWLQASGQQASTPISHGLGSWTVNAELVEDGVCGNFRFATERFYRLQVILWKKNKGVAVVWDMESGKPKEILRVDLEQQVGRTLLAQILQLIRNGASSQALISQLQTAVRIYSRKAAEAAAAKGA